MNSPSKRVTVLVGPQFLAALLSASSPIETIEWALSRSEQVGIDQADFWRQIHALFATDMPPAGPAVGALRRIGEGASADGYRWMAVDPVFVTPNRDHLVVMPPQQLAITHAEATVLVAALNENFSVDGLHFEFQHPARWYVRVDDSFEVFATPLLQSVGRNVREVLPQGVDARRWTRLWNEIQMVMHGSAVNQVRERARQPMVNSVWAWGLGRLPEVKQGTFDVCVTDEPYVRGLAMLAQCRVLSQDTALREMRFGTRTLWVLEADHFQTLDPDACATQCGRVVDGLVQQLKEKRVDELDFVVGDFTYRLSRAGIRKFWRRRRPLLAWAGGVGKRE